MKTSVILEIDVLVRPFVCKLSFIVRSCAIKQSLPLSHSHDGAIVMMFLSMRLQKSRCKYLGTEKGAP
eukprot:54306-Pelagomonas_calceolata.AAC.1